jgi:hypothetical protein
MHVSIVIDFIIISYLLFYKRNSFLDSASPAASSEDPKPGK